MPIDHLILEVLVFSFMILFAKTVLGQIFLLPKPPFREVYYSDIIADLCKMRPSIPPILAHAIETLFERIDTMDAGRHTWIVD